MLIWICFIVCVVSFASGIIVEKFINFYKHKKNSQKTETFVENSPENFIEKKLETLQDNLSQLINNFKDQSTSQDKVFVEKITKLDTNLKNFESQLIRKEDFLKKDLSNQNAILDSKITDVIKDITNIKQSTNTLTSLDQKVQSLQNVFLNSKRRGNLGEYQLDRILSDIYPKSSIWKLQYQLKGTNIIVDAYLSLANSEEGIAIDAKFPFDNYNKHFDHQDKIVRDKYLQEFKKDVKNRINEVAKYIDEFKNIKSAIMFIPSEEVFRFIYDKFSDVIDYAFKKHVWLTSPTTLSAILFAIDKHVKEIETNNNIENIKKHLLKMQNEFKRWINRWDNFKETINKVPEKVKDLDITQNKIEKQYDLLLNQDFSPENAVLEKKSELN